MCKEEDALCEIGLVLQQKSEIPRDEIKASNGVSVSGIVSLLKASGLVEHNEKTGIVRAYPEIMKFNGSRFVRLRTLLKIHPGYKKAKGQRLVDFVQKSETKRFFRRMGIDPQLIIDRSVGSAKKFYGKKPYRKGVKTPILLDKVEWLNKKAYVLWEKAGRPEGQAEYFWSLAEQEFLALPKVQKRLFAS